MSSYIDTHAHLYLPEFDSDRDNVVEAAVNLGIGKIFLPNIDSSSIDEDEPAGRKISRYLLSPRWDYTPLR